MKMYPSVRVMRMWRFEVITTETKEKSDRTVT
jgi:hypothetical protein